MKEMHFFYKQMYRYHCKVVDVFSYLSHIKIHRFKCHKIVLEKIYFTEEVRKVL